MAAPMHHTKLPKSQRKLFKKQSKIRQILSKQDNVHTVSYATRILCVSNAGLDNGVSREEVFQLFSCHGNVLDIIMLPKKPYAFVCYAAENEAEGAYNALNGYKLAPSLDRQEETILYISYVSKAPECLSPSSQMPPGLVVLPDFVTDQYAHDILGSVHWNEHTSTAQRRELKHRRVRHYGYEFKYSINNVDPDDPLPDEIPQVYKGLLEAAIETGYVKHYPDQLTVNQYQPGQGIPPHVDTPSAFEDGLMSLSLGSQVLMEFRHPDGRQLSVLLPPNSLLIMTGESRYIWTHGITPRKSDIVTAPGGGLTLSKRGVRTSFTFRKITGVKHTDGASSKQSLPTTDTAAAQLENHHVHQVYEEIAGHFSGTRHTPWPQIAEFLHQQAPGSLLADIGCGNGKYFGINKDLFEIGSDRSSNLAGIVRDRGFQVFVGDVLSIPLRPGSMDVCLCIAVIHHLSTHERRLRALDQLLDALRAGGKLLVYVWAMEQQLNKVKSKYITKGKGDIVNNSVVELKSEEQFSEVETHIEDGGVIASKNSGNENQTKLTECIESVKELIVHEPTSAGDGLMANAYRENEIDNTASEVSNKLVTHSKGQLNSEMNRPRLNPCVESQDIKDHRLEAYTSHSDKAGATERKGGSLAELEVHVNRTEFKQQDLLVPWQLKQKPEKGAASKEEPQIDNVFHRYYHVFKEGELESLCSELPCCKIVKSYYDQGNWAVILEKV